MEVWELETSFRQGRLSYEMSKFAMQIMIKIYRCFLLSIL